MEIPFHKMMNTAVAEAKRKNVEVTWVPPAVHRLKTLLASSTCVIWEYCENILQRMRFYN